MAADYASTGHGGGVVRIDATGTATIFGTITVRGVTGAGRQGGGSGGPIYITCYTFAGSTNGLVRVSGGNGGSSSGGGGGGRIAVQYTAGQGSPGVRFQATLFVDSIDNSWDVICFFILLFGTPWSVHVCTVYITWFSLYYRGDINGNHPR